MADLVGYTPQEVLRNFLDRKGLGLEIGPLHRAVAPKREGFRVEILDHADTGSLRAKYAADTSVDVSLIEEVDFVSDGRSMVEAVGQRGRYDWVVASHVIEHTPDLLGFLLDCEALLRPGGLLALAVPDKRLCFDAKRPLSTVGEILQAHHERRTRHPPGVIFDALAYYVRRSGLCAWMRTHTGEYEQAFTMEEAFAQFQHATTDENYHDVHGWVFTASSFRLAMQSLQRLGVLSLREAGFVPCHGCEFFMAMSPAGPGCPFEGAELTRMVEAESALELDPNAPNPELVEIQKYLDTLKHQLREITERQSYRALEWAREVKARLVPTGSLRDRVVGRMLRGGLQRVLHHASPRS